jgi:hypothetical protein
MTEYKDFSIFVQILGSFLVGTIIVAVIVSIMSLYKVRINQRILQSYIDVQTQERDLDAKFAKPIVRFRRHPYPYPNRAINQFYRNRMSHNLTNPTDAEKLNNIGGSRIPPQFLHKYQ